eukprot:TRINITY_DN1167_c0_g1_i4.p1 TRINITY_DN1167_c0_g1~~TRINITY_DN1167_c0_g1_i4.p1  ORF type:complete len:365 (-),score=106.08 TRINITY_DN1167_c0_g1_i4:256-1350(-)
MKVWGLFLVIWVFAVAKANIVSIDVKPDTIGMLIGDVMVGSPAQKLPVAFTMIYYRGSFLIDQSYSKQYGGPEGLPYFNTTQSHTVRVTHEAEPYKCNFGGSFDGVKAFDNIAFGGPHSAIRGFSFDLARQSHACNDWGNDHMYAGHFNIGIKKGESTVFTELYDQGVISKMYMHLKMESGLAKGKLSFGDVLDGSYGIKWSPSVGTLSGPKNPKHGVVPIPDGMSFEYMIAGKSASFGEGSFDVEHIVFDFFHGFGAPMEFIEPLVKILNAKQMQPGVPMYFVDCDAIPTFPSITYTLATGATITLRASEYIKNDMNGTCSLRIFYFPSLFRDGKPVWAIGYAGLVNNDIIFNGSDGSVGIRI